MHFFVLFSPQEKDICLLDNSKLRQRLKQLQDLLYLYELQLKDILENTYHRTKSGLFSGNRSVQHEVLLPTTSGNLIVYDQGTVCSSVSGNFSLPQCLFLPAVSYMSYFISAKSFRILKVDCVLKCTWEGKGQTGGPGTSRHPLGPESAGPALGSYRPGTMQTPAAGLLTWDSGAERNRHLSDVFHQTYFRHLL